MRVEFSINDDVLWFIDWVDVMTRRMEHRRYQAPEGYVNILRADEHSASILQCEAIRTGAGNPLRMGPVVWFQYEAIEPTGTKVVARIDEAAPVLGLTQYLVEILGHALLTWDEARDELMPTIQKNLRLLVPNPLFSWEQAEEINALARAVEELTVDRRLETDVAGNKSNPGDAHYAFPDPVERQAIVSHYRTEAAKGRIKNKEAWAQTNYNITRRTLLNYEKEFPGET